MKSISLLVVGVALGFAAAVVLDLVLHPMETLENAPTVASAPAPEADPADDQISALTAEKEDLQVQVARLQDQLAAARMELAEAAADPEPDPAVAEAGEEGRTRGRNLRPRGEGGAVTWMNRTEQLSPEEIRRLVASEDPRERARGVAALSQLPDQAEAVALAQNLLSSDQPWLRGAALRELTRIGGPEAVQAVAAILRDENPWLKSQAVRALGQMGDASALPALRETYAASSDRLKLESALSLRKLGEPTAAQELGQTAIVQLGNPDGGLRVEAVRTLSSLEDPVYNPTFVQALSDTNSDVREAAARSLAMRGTVTEIPALQALAADPVSSVAAAAQDAIRYIEDPSLRERRRGPGGGGERRMFFGR